jgi:asparagine synthase (glutamine-hydrolysing)
MCGIAGLWTAESVSAERLGGFARSMADALVHRGPDDSGVWVDAQCGVAFGHRRLSIVDLSPEGRQPMISPSGRYVICFNGEVFNHAELRDELEKDAVQPVAFRGHSDTEIMLAAIERWGVARSVERFVGMFAFALWDRERSRLFLVRDRLGIKPLYYGIARRAVVFGSELKALTTHVDFSRDLDRTALTQYLRFGYVPAPLSIYRSAKKLEPGCVLELEAPNLESAKRSVYWSALDVAERGLEHPFRGTEQEAIEELERLLSASVKLRLVADVPVGAFLSGGIDSSTVVALMQRATGSPVHTFSIANEGAAYDESEAALGVARHLGTRHEALTVTAEDARAVVPLLPRIYDEPFADSSQIPTYLVSRLARHDVSVALSGDGGDELFGGYNRHVWAPAIWAALRRVPKPMRALCASVLRRAPPKVWDRLFGIGEGLLPAIRTPGVKVNKLARVLDSASADDLYRRLVSVWDCPAELVRDGPRQLAEPLPEVSDGAATMMLRDLVTYLPDDILTKVDRASMAVSLEARVPLLDHRVVEYAWTLPESLKVRRRTGKWILRQVLSRHVPAALFERPKMGFAVPLGDWLRGPLREWASDLLASERLRRSEHLIYEPIEQAWRDHLSGRRENEHALWAVLMFQAWSN